MSTQVVDLLWNEPLPEAGAVDEVAQGAKGAGAGPSVGEGQQYASELTLNDAAGAPYSDETLARILVGEYGVPL